MKSCIKFCRPVDTRAAFDTLFKTADADRFGVTQSQWEGWLHEIAETHFGPAATPGKTIAFCRTLHLHDLLLARACSLQISAAWEELIAIHRSAVYRAALRIADTQRACELAQSLWTDLYCAPLRLASYSARGPLESWLKANLYQSNINLFRAERRFVTLEEGLSCVCHQLAPHDFAQRQVDALTQQSLQVALQKISPEDRFLLSSYFLERRNLSQISLALNVHESTVSRRIGKLLRQLRRDVLRCLRAHGVSDSFTFSIQSDFDLGRELS